MDISHKQGSYKVYCHNVESSLIAAFFQLGHLLGAGIGVDQSIRELILLESRWSLRRVWRDVERSVVDGQALSVSMQRWPTVFDSTLIALLKSGESCGQLSSACDDCQLYLEWQQNIKARISAVLLYPLFALVMVVGVLGFLMVYLVPTLESLLKSSGYEFPWHAQVLLVISQWAKDYLLYALSGVCIVYVVLYVARVANGRVRLISDAVLLKIPLYGYLTLNLTFSRYCEMCSRLYGSGIALTDAMEKSEAFIKNRALKLQLQQARMHIVAGQSLSAALASVLMLSSIHVQVLGAGEMTGKLALALSRTGTQQRRTAEIKIDRIEKLLGPLVLVVAGAALLWVVFSLLGPIYQNAVETVVLT